MFSKSNLAKLLRTTGVVGLVIYGFFVAQVIVALLLGTLVQAGVMTNESLQSATVQFNASLAAYSFALVIILGIFTAIRNSAQDLAKILAIGKRPKISMLMYLVVGYGVYFLLSIVFLLIAQSVIPGFSVDQEQNVGFDQLGSRFEYVMAFIALVVLAPIVEEVIFRGFLFTQVRKNLHFWWTALIVSIVFGLIHLQWNVGVDVFALSLVLCYIREKTGTIWAGIGIHMLKNLLAYTILFLQFDIEKVIQQFIN